MRREGLHVTAILVFERAWLSLKRYRPSGSFKSWLFTIAQRGLSDHYRRRKPLPVRVDAVADTLLDPAAGPEESALASEELRQVLDIIAGLSREQQEVIALRFMAELPRRAKQVLYMPPVAGRKNCNVHDDCEPDALARVALASASGSFKE